MDISITWHPPRPSGVRTCHFEHDGKRVEMSAAVCVQKTWKGKPGSETWLKDRDTWAQEHAATISARLDYESSPEGIKRKAQAEYDRLQDQIDAATQRRAKLKIDYPDLVSRKVK